MIYLDNSATTFPKPVQVSRAVDEALRNYSANPGRSGHKLSLKASEEIYKCRVKVGQLFNVDKEEQVIFTSNCTHGLNIVIKGYLKRGDHVVVSNLEHNSVTRPLTELSKYGINFTQATVFYGDPEETINSFRNAINEKTKLVICTHASNVFGIRLPIDRIAALCHMYGIKVLIDGAQSAGVLPVNIKDYDLDFFAAAGHKGLYGPMGTGILIVKDSEDINSLMEGGTGSSSDSFKQPSILPDKFESGTPNLPGIAGLGRGVDFVMKKTPEYIANHEMKLIQRLYKNLSSMSKVILYTEEPCLENSAPVLSFNIKNSDSEDVAYYLDKKYGIAVRAGLHCAPSAHTFMNTMETGTVRVSPSVFTTVKEIDMFSRAIRQYN